MRNILPLSLLIPTLAHAAGVFVCVDASGHRYAGDEPPAACRAVTELRPDGAPVPSPLTVTVPAADDGRRRDRALVDRFPTLVSFDEAWSEEATETMRRLAVFDARVKELLTEREQLADRVSGYVLHAPPQNLLDQQTHNEYLLTQTYAARFQLFEAYDVLDKHRRVERARLQSLGVR